MGKKVGFLIFSAALVLSMNYALERVHAGPIYNYVGQPFTVTNSPFTTGDKITGFVEFASEPTPLEFFKSDVVAFSFSAGPLTLTSSSNLFTAFSFNFDVVGDILDWALIVQSGAGEPFAPPDDRIRSCNNPGALVVVGIVGCNSDTVSDDANASGLVQSCNLQSPGEWTRRIVAAPAPLTLTYVGSVLASAALVRFLRKSSRSGSIKATSRLP